MPSVKMICSRTPRVKNDLLTDAYRAHHFLTDASCNLLTDAYVENDFLKDAYLEKYFA